MTHTYNIKKVYSISEIDNLIKRSNKQFKYTLSDAILFLLFADENPIKGKTKQMKEIFLMLNEILDKQDVQPVYFERKRFGPYCEEVEYSIDHLVISNYISMRGKKNSNDFAIEITPKGREYIKSKYYELPSEIQQMLKRKRTEWDTHIIPGLLKLVYTHYEDYLENSALKNRYEVIDWNNINQIKKKK